MQISSEGLTFIKSWERLFLRAYDDATERVVIPDKPVKGILTIGYGHTDAAGKPVVFVGQEITEKEADSILLSDLAPVEKAIARLVHVHLSQPQYDALVSFQFNTGWLEHPHCSLLLALNAGNYALAAHDFMLYDRANGHVLKGLNRRRRAEMEIFNGGHYEAA